MPGGGEVGQAWWEADLKDEKLKAKLRELDALLRQQGQMSEATLNRGWAVAADNAGKSLQKLGRGMTSVGDSMTRSLTLPIVGLGAAPGKMALDFDTTLRQTVGLAGVAQGAIGGIREEILAMAGDVGKGPQELAEAFYFVASAGFEADEAMEVLKVSAKAAASGLGETQTIAQVLGGVINAYGKENMTAARAADILTEAVAQGTAEASGFASVIGNVVPGAAALGVSFDQVTAAMAGMTLSGVGVEESATSLINIFSSLQKPTVQAEAALQGLGLSSAELRRQLREEGLLSTLRTLEERFAGNETASAAVFGNIRALRGVTALLGLDTQQLNDVFAEVEDSLGRQQEAYEATEGPQRDVDRAMADISATAIELGQDVLPIVVDVLQEMAGGARDLAAWWRSLDDDTKRLVIQVAAFIAVAGPALSIVGKLTGAVGGLFRAVGFLAGAKGIPLLDTKLKALGLAGAGPLGVIIALGAAVHELGGNADITQKLTRLKEAMEGAGISGEEFAAGVEKSGKNMNEFTDEVLALIDSGELAGRAFRMVRDGVESIPWDHQRDEVQEAGLAWERYQKQISGETVDAVDEASAALAELPPEVRAQLEAAGIAVDQTAPEAFDGGSEEAAKARAEAVRQMGTMLSNIASLFETDETLRDAFQALLDRMDDPYTEAERRADIFSRDTIAVIRGAIQSGDPDVAGDMQQLVESALGQIETMQPGALAAGEAVPTKIRDGMDGSMQELIDWIEGTLNVDILTGLTQLEADEAGVGNIRRYAEGMRRNEMEATAEARYVAGRAKVGLEDADFYGGGRSVVTDKYAPGIDEGQGAARRAAQRVSAAARLATFNEDWYGAGYNIGVAWANGLRSAKDYARINAWELAASTKPGLHGLSPPKEGPLRDIDIGGRNIGLAWAKGFGSVIPEVKSQAGGLAAAAAAALAMSGSATAGDLSLGSIVPPFVGAGSAGNGAAAGGGAPIENHWHTHLHVEGREPIVSNGVDAFNQMTRLLWLEGAPVTNG